VESIHYGVWSAWFYCTVGENCVGGAQEVGKQKGPSGNFRQGTRNTNFVHSNDCELERMSENGSMNEGQFI
jgi:hypothetical protein